MEEKANSVNHKVIGIEYDHDIGNVTLHTFNGYNASFASFTYGSQYAPTDDFSNFDLYSQLLPILFDLRKTTFDFSTD